MMHVVPMPEACAEGYVGNVSEERRGWDGVFERS